MNILVAEPRGRHFESFSPFFSPAPVMNWDCIWLQDPPHLWVRKELLLLQKQPQIILLVEIFHSAGDSETADELQRPVQLTADIPAALTA